MTACPECKEPIDPAAYICPHCRHHLKLNPAAKGLVVVAIILTAIAVYFSIMR